MESAQLEGSMERGRAQLAELDAQARAVYQQVVDRVALDVHSSETEAIRDRVVRDFHTSFRAKVAQLEEEADHYRSLYNSTRRDLVTVSTELECARREHAGQLEQQQAQREAEADILRTRARQEADCVHQLRVNFEAEKLQMSKSIAILQTQLELVRAELGDKKRKDAPSAVHCISDQEMRRFIELEATRKVLEEERSHARCRIAQLEKALKDAESECARERLEAVQQQNRQASTEALLQQNQAQLQAVVQQEQRVWRERESQLTSQQQQLAERLEEARAETDQWRRRFKDVMDSKACQERDSTARLERQQSQSQARLEALEREKRDIEAKLTELRHVKADTEKTFVHDKAQLRTQLESLQTAKSSLECELAAVNAKVEHFHAAQKELEASRSELAHTRELLERTRAESAGVARLEDELKQGNERLQRDVSLLSAQLSRTKALLDSAKHKQYLIAQESESVRAEENRALTGRIAELEAALEKFSLKLQRAAQIHARKKAHYRSVIEGLKARVRRLEPDARLPVTCPPASKARVDEKPAENRTLSRERPQRSPSSIPDTSPPAARPCSPPADNVPVGSGPVSFNGHWPRPAADLQPERSVSPADRGDDPESALDSIFQAAARNQQRRELSDSHPRQPPDTGLKDAIQKFKYASSQTHRMARGDCEAFLGTPPGRRVQEEQRDEDDRLGALQAKLDALFAHQRHMIDRFHCSNTQRAAQLADKLARLQSIP